MRDAAGCLPESGALALISLVVSLAVAVVVAVAMAGDPPPSGGRTPDPCPGCTAGERDAYFATMLASREEWRYQFIEEVASAGLDPRSLPRGRSLVDFVSGFDELYPSVDEAARGADLILEVRVTDVTFFPDRDGPGYSAKTTAQVLAVLKGDAGGSVRFLQFGYPVRADDGSVFLMESDALPLLLAGDRALILLEETEGWLRIVPYLGWYRISGNTVELPPGRPRVLGTVAGGASVETLQARLTRALESPASP